MNYKVAAKTKKRSRSPRADSRARRDFINEVRNTRTLSMLYGDDFVPYLYDQLEVIEKRGNSIYISNGNNLVEAV